MIPSKKRKIRKKKTTKLLTKQHSTKQKKSNDTHKKKRKQIQNLNSGRQIEKKKAQAHLDSKRRKF